MSVQNRHMLSCYAPEMPDTRCQFLIDMDQKEYPHLVEETGQPESPPLLVHTVVPSALGVAAGCVLAGAVGMLVAGPLGAAFCLKTTFGIGASWGGATGFIYGRSEKLNPWENRSVLLFSYPIRIGRLCEKINLIAQQLQKTGDSQERSQLQLAQAYFQESKTRCETYLQEQGRPDPWAEERRRIAHQQTMINLGAKYY